MVAAIVLDPTTGPVGTVVTVTGTGFTPLADPVTVTYGGAAIATTPTPVVVDAMGEFSFDITIPASVAGAHEVLCNDGTLMDGADFTVTPLIALSDNAGVFGDTTTVTGTGFAGTSATTIEANGNDVTGAALTTSAVGSFSRAITIPDMPQGVNAITATDAAMNTDSENYTMSPSIVINPTSAETGSNIAIVCHGFAALEAISVTVDTRPATLPTTPTTDADGLAAGVFTVPQDVSLGAVTVSATDVSLNNATTSLTIITAVTDPLNHGPMAQRKLPSGLFTTPVISVDGAAMEALLTIDARNYEKVLVMIQNIDDTNEADFNLFGSLEAGESSPVFSTATWTQILTSDVAIDKGVTKPLICSDPYLWLVVAGKKHAGDAESQVLVYARGVNNGPNS